MGEDEFTDDKKPHMKRKSGKKFDKKKSKDGHEQEMTARQRNPKAFAIQNVTKAERRVRRKEDIGEKRAHQPLVDRTPVEPPPIVVAIVGPPKVGKTTLLHCLVKNFTRQTLTNIQGPVTVVSGKKRRLTLIECPNDVNSMIDIAKVADLVLLLVDASFGFEMEIFEFLNICQVHGFPRIMGVLTHLDTFKNAKTLQRTKKNLKQRFWTEVYQGAKLFYLSGMVHGEYQKTEVHNLGRFISVMKFRPLVWRSTHPYLLGDRMEDVTDPEVLRTQPKADRTVALYGYLRGTNMKSNQGLHLAGVGDFSIQSISFLPDPCPLPEGIKKRTLVEKDKTIYAPMSGVGGIVYDKDAVYIDLGGSHAHKKGDAKDDLVQNMINTESTLNDKLEQSELRLFSGSKPISSAEHKQGEGRERRKAVFEDGKDDVRNDDNDDDESDDDLDVEDEEEGEDEEDESDEEIEAKNSKKRKVEDVAPSPLKKKKEDNVIKSRNKQLLMEMGEDVGESDDDSDDDNFPAPEESLDVDNSAKDVPDTFHHRLSTKKDESVHSKVTEALSNIKEKEPEESDEDESDEEDSEEEEEEEEEDEEEPMNEEDRDEASESLHWKADLAMKARDSFYARQSGTASLRRLVYGVSGQVEEDKMGQEDDTVGGLFTVVKAKGGVAKQEMDSLDCTVWSVEHSQDWDREEIKDRIKDCFVTGQWAKGQDAEELIKLDDEDEVYGDFEDLETGQVVSGEKEEEEEEELPRMVDLKGDRDTEMAKRKERMERKLKLKRSFDTDYDGGEGDKGTYYEDLKKEVDDQSNLNRSEFDGVDDSLRVQYEGYRSGMYVRLELGNIPCEMVEHFSPSSPLIMGGLLKGEDQLGYIQVRVKKHRWYPRILKNRDPLIISLGWRRFQSLPIYSICDHNMRHRMLKYTPEHLHCDAHFWGPITPQGTGMMAVQSVADRQENFKIVATGVVLELDKTTQIVKKLKLTGEPYKIFKKTAFIKGMFNSSLEVAKFEKAGIRTVSGVRGMIKKSLSEHEGAFRATFEDKILMSDIVFVKTWFAVEVPKFYAIVTNLLQKEEERSTWKGMRTVGEIKRENNIRNEVLNDDSLYKEIKREAKVFNPLQIPRNLQAELPYSLKPKIVAKGLDPTKDRVAVVLDHEERKVQNAFKMLREMYGQKQITTEKEKKKRVEGFIQKQNVVEEKKMKRQKEARKQISRMMSRNKAKAERMASRKGGNRSKE
eukprot:TRINITY_DN9120_c0_g1_i1.p1 TRINITY_DN9120_c0_g1~~TRINITY_DN9120_c0_g1_i1.p1  ORF type:complete len:1240 (-),score=545.03 TRINITY_DN9120_c0_g1_i1:50-3718(-)